MQPTRCPRQLALARKWIALRNRIYGSARFRSFALRTPIIRAVGQRKASALFDLVSGFVYSQILLACIQTRLIERLQPGPLAVADAAALADLPLAAADRLLKAAAAIGIAQRLADDRYMLGAQGASLCASPGVMAMIAHHPLLYADLNDPVALLRTGRGQGALAEYWNYADGHTYAATAAPYSALMAASQTMVAEQVTRRYSFGRHRRLLDVGGGTGTFVRAIAAAHPQLETAVFDLPAVTGQLPGNVAGFAGNFLTDELPGGFDIVSLVRVLHDHDDGPAMILLRAIAAALPAGGTILIAEPMARTRGARGMGDAYFGLYLWAMGSGRPRSEREIGAMLKEAGFDKIRRFSTDLPLVATIMTARRQNP